MMGTCHPTPGRKPALDLRLDRVLSGQAGAPVLLSPEQLAEAAAQLQRPSTSAPFGVPILTPGTPVPVRGAGACRRWQADAGVTRVIALSSMPLLLHTTWAAEVCLLR